MDQSLEFVVKVEPESLSRSANNIWGRIWCEWGEHSFPQRQWSDIAESVLSWWLEVTISLVDGGERSVEISFLDGPFEVRMRALNKGRWEAELVEGGVSGWTIQHRFEFDPATHIRSLTFCSDAVLERCSKEGWSSSDIDSINLHRDLLVQYLAKKTNDPLP